MKFGHRIAQLVARLHSLSSARGMLKQVKNVVMEVPFARRVDQASKTGVRADLVLILFDLPRARYHRKSGV